MMEPAISVLREKADSRYSLVIMAARRARDLVDGKPPILPSNERSNVTKPVSIAVNEIAKDMISYTRGKDTDQEELDGVKMITYRQEKAEMTPPTDDKGEEE